MAVVPSVIFSMRSPRIKISWFFRGVSLCPSIKVPARMTVKGATATVCPWVRAAFRTNVKINPEMVLNRIAIPPDARIGRLSLSECAAGNPGFSSAEEISLNAPVAVFLRPETERNGREVIHGRHGIAILGQIDGAQIALTGFAGFHADVRELFRNEDRQLVFALLAAMGAENPAEFPLLRAERALQESLSAVAFHSQHGQQGQGIAPRAAADGHRQGRRQHCTRHKFSVGL